MRIHRICALCLGAAFSLAFIDRGEAGLVGSSYNWSSAATGNTEIAPGPGPIPVVDPNTQAYCVGPPVACDQGAGLFGNYSFSDAGPGKSIITFVFFGSTGGAGPGSFQIRFSDFVFADPSKQITDVSWLGGNLSSGDFTSASWDGTGLTFTGTTASDFSAIGGSTIGFSVTQVPEPGSVALLGTGVFALAAIRRRRNRV